MQADDCNRAGLRTVECNDPVGNRPRYCTDRPGRAGQNPTKTRIGRKYSRAIERNGNPIINIRAVAIDRKADRTNAIGTCKCIESQARSVGQGRDRRRYLRPCRRGQHPKDKCQDAKHATRLARYCNPGNALGAASPRGHQKPVPPCLVAARFARSKLCR